MTIEDLRLHCLSLLEGRENADRDIDHLLRHVLRKDPSWVLAHAKAPVSHEQAEAVAAFCKRRAQNEPLAYLLGSQPFYGREFVVSPDVLIPRPESELLIDALKRDLASKAAPTIVDVGTGSGCLAITAALEVPHARILAVDVSGAALAIARKNLEKYKTSTVELVQGDLLQPVLDRGLYADAILANLPYLPEEELNLSPTKEELAFEPRQALVAQDGGLALIKRCTQQAANALSCGGKLYLEMLPGQIPIFSVWLMRSGLPYRSEILADLAGLDRDIVLTKTC